MRLAGQNKIPNNGDCMEYIYKVILFRHFLLFICIHTAHDYSTVLDSGKKVIHNSFYFSCILCFHELHA